MTLAFLYRAKNSVLLQGMSVQVALIGPDGIMLNSTTGITDRIDLSDRAHFRHHLDPSASQPYISVPMIGRASGKLSIQITRRVTRKDGNFGGVVVVSIDPLYFSKFFDKVDLRQNGVVALVGRDGIVRARRGPRGFDIGQNVSDTRLFERISNSDAGTFMVQSKLDGVARIYGYSSVPGYPLLVAVGIAMDGVRASSNQVLASHAAIGGALTFIILMFSSNSWDERTRQRSHRALDGAARRFVSHVVRKANPVRGWSSTAKISGFSLSTTPRCDIMGMRASSLSP